MHKLFLGTNFAKIPPNLKISPLAAVPHKSHPFRAIVDLSYQLCTLKNPPLNVNDSTKPWSHPKVMKQLGQVLPHVIYNVATAPLEHGLVYLEKWDLKDGFWCLSVSSQDVWHFCHLLPALPGEPPMVVVPNSLQMGWIESPGLFCSATETARDIAQDLLNNPTLELPPHPLETFCAPTLPLATCNTYNPLAAPPLWLLEVYVNDFLGLAQASSAHQLLQFSRAVLHGIHHIFPPATITNKSTDEPIAIKKLLKGDGRWDTTKKILGWTVDGNLQCISLPSDKHERLSIDLTKFLCQWVISIRQLQKLLGRHMHAAVGIPNGKGLLSPMVAVVAKNAKNKNKCIKISSELYQTVRDWQSLLLQTKARLTPCQDLIPAPPNFIGYCGASRLGAGGVWFGGNKLLPPIVWRLAFPSDIQSAIITTENPNGHLTNSDFEMAGLLCQWLVLELIASKK